MNINLLEQDTKSQLYDFLEMCKKIDKNTNTKKIEKISLETIKYLLANKEKRPTLLQYQELENRWYKSLKKNSPDFSVYGTEEYMAELFACWIVYSKKYIKNLANAKSLETKSIISDFGKVKKIVDLGCGFGYTTAALKIIFPNAEVYGTNLEDTFQIKFARNLSKKYNFNIITDYKEAGMYTDVLFASEYFEHIKDPIKDLHKIFMNLRPKNIIMANSFNTHAVGHFTEYIVSGGLFGEKIIDQKYISKMFNEELKIFGYKKIKTKLWNNRPSYYKFGIGD